MHPIVIIGSGLAGYMLAKEFRKLDKTTPLTIVTASEGRFYSKPQLSNAFIHKKNVETLVIASADEMRQQLNARILTLTKVVSIDTHRNVIHTDDQSIEYSHLVLACGANPIKLPLVGDAVDAILSVNDLEAYGMFRKTLEGKKRIAIVGAGLVGCEFANDLVHTGHIIDIIALSHYPLDTLLPEEIGKILWRAFAAEGIHWHLEQLIMSIDKTAHGYLVKLSGEAPLQTDVVLSAVGLQPHTGLAETAGLKIGRGIIVDQYCRTSVNNIYALGDCAEVNGLVLLFVAPLLNCARALAKTLAGESTQVVYPAMPIIIKTPICPIVVLPPPRELKGQWHITGRDKHFKALFCDEEKRLHGFALTGDSVKEKMLLIKKLSPAC